jgi:hypothetical protein
LGVIKTTLNISYFALDLTAKVIGKTAKFVAPKLSKKIVSTVKSNVQNLKKQLQKLSPNKSFALVAGISSLAYIAAPIYITAHLIHSWGHSLSTADKLMALVPKVFQLSATGFNYLCWENASQSKGFNFLNTRYKHVKETLQEFEDWTNKKFPAYNKLKYAFKKALSYLPKKAQNAKIYKNKFAKIGAKIIPGYRRADKIQGRINQLSRSLTLTFSIDTTSMNEDYIKGKSLPIVPFHIETTVKNTSALSSAFQVDNNISTVKMIERITQPAKLTI